MTFSIEREAMEFHEYRLTKKDAEVGSSDITAMSLDRYYDLLLDKLYRERGYAEYSPIVLAEMGYVKCKRPFYNVYPAVAECLENTKLDFELKQVKLLDEVISMCFAKGKEPELSNGKVAAMLVELRGSALNINTNTISKDPLLRIAVDRIVDNGSRARSAVIYNRKGLISDAADELGDKRKLVSLAIGVSLLAQDARFAEPILLKRDQGKQLDEESLQKAVARARNNGRNGFVIGRGLEVSPHMRKPHFAVRWTEKGRTVPRLVPVKGCVVSRDKLFPVPTGHLDK